ncbi:peptidoglycan-binding domain-containing protein [Pseudomonas japonica]|uniref:N-acetylmuramoyl-L-alanine amidase n=1 Tax=Pseudomonas japonica TaxID=256466 RepID=A0A239KIJ6_9PSED|nr:peptidoglycan-binding domain-containing protein [Pseudomonas japonica]SNT18177.1 N-acetylmuramoyl-L-alanine amidase [Pseudomonas japonica]
MPIYHLVSGNDSVDSIAYDNGLYWQTLWHHPNNAELRQARGDQRNILAEGDRLFVPDITPRDVAKALDRRHRFRRKGIPVTVEVRLTENDDEPRADLGYRIKAGKRETEGRSDADGWIRFGLMPDIGSGTLTLETGETFDLVFSSMRPSATLKGVQGRLRNLGYFDGPPDGKTSPALDAALRHFQALCGLQVTGEVNDATIAELERRHGS